VAARETFAQPQILFGSLHFYNLDLKPCLSTAWLTGADLPEDLVNIHSKSLTGFIIRDNIALHG
jgi:hypothetical protein